VRTDVRNDLRMNVRTNLLLPKDLVEEVDRVAGPRGRSRYVTEALRAKVKRDRLKDAIERTAGVLHPKDYPEWSTSEKVVEWVRARRAETTESGQ
jgi:metal-responsive CopG/Arc/MetJ family transcriptional regulator